MVSVADELIFERMLDEMSPETRASVERVMASRGYGGWASQRDLYDDDELIEARRQGYENGLAAGRAEKKASSR